jgi:hypothetical protein
MAKYLNRSGESGIMAYEIGDDYIKIQFKTGSVYSYSYGIAGNINVENMKILATSGSGLNSYIIKNVKKLYD